MIIVEKVYERINDEKTKLYKKILENLGEPQLNENNIEDNLKNLEKTLNGFLDDILDLETFKAKRSEIQGIIIEAQELKKDKDLVEKILYTTRKSKLKRKIKKSFIRQLKNFKQIREGNKRILLRINESEELEQLYNVVNNFWVVEPLLKKNHDQNYIERLQNIYRSNRFTNDRVLEALHDLIPFWKRIATEEVKKTFSGNLNDLNYLQRNIAIYTNYLKINILYDLDLSEIYENCLSELHQTDRHLKYEIQLVKEKMERTKDWIENYSKYLKMFKKAKKGRIIFINEEHKALKVIFTKLKKEMKEHLKTTRKAGYVYARRILNLIQDYDDVYNFTKLRIWAQETFDRYVYLRRN